MEEEENFDDYAGATKKGLEDIDVDTDNGDNLQTNAMTAPTTKRGGQAPSRSGVHSITHSDSESVGLL